MRLLKWSLATLVALLLAGAGGAYLAVRASLPQLDGTLATTELRQPVTIERDSLGIVTVTAPTRADIAFGLGVVHAQDRFFQMDLTRRMAAGRLAELFGDQALETDRRNRLHRFSAVADRILDTLPVEHGAVIDAYTAGVNTGLGSLRVRPFEYLLLRAEPEAWHPRDTLLCVFAMYLQLNDSRAGADRQRALIRDTVPPEVSRFIYSVAPEWEAPIDGLVMAAAAVPPAEVYDLQRFEDEFRSQQVAAQTPVEPRALGSNNWAVAGSHTRSGAGLLANDMHLGLGIPNTWYRARMRVPGEGGIDINGATLPGAPTLVVGSNGRIAWGFTNSYGDWSDLVRVELSGDRMSYRSASGWKPLRRHKELLRSSGGRSEELEILATEWGPLVDPDAQGNALALRWTAHDPDASNLRWLLLEHAGSVEEALALAPTIGGPVQNFVVVDSAGDVGWTLIGRMPQRGPNYDPGVPGDWTQPGAGWVGWRDPAEYPRVTDPLSGRIWSANNRVVGGAMLEAIGDGSPDRGARAQQIRDALFAIDRATESDMLAVQLDDRALFLQRWYDLLLATLDPQALAGHPQRGEFRASIEKWEPHASVSSVGYRLTRAFHETLERRIFDALTVEVRSRHPDAKLSVPRQFEEAAWRLVTEQPVHLLDPRYPSWRDFVLSALDETIEQLAGDCPEGLDDCTWGERNVIRIQHPLSRAVPALGRWLDMPAVPAPGDQDMPRVQSPGFGASERLAVSPGHEPDGYFHMPGGQSGHPLSPFYSAGHEAWLAGEKTPFLPGATVHELRVEAR
jgi:penicillin amidase